MTDHEYIKMILALPDEFFAGWEWQAGDKALSINDQYKRELLLLTTAPIKKLNSNDNVKLLFSHSVDGVTVEEYIFNLRLVPSQQQLQKLSGLGWDLYYHDLVKNYSEYDSDEQAGLAMITYMKYGKIWDGEHWV